MTENVKAKKTHYVWLGLAGFATYVVLAGIWPASQQFANNVVKVVLDFFYSL
ncbi:hypothetical protein [Schleiferilactobacillus harbinensis]|jgi:hypothetical protein